MKEKVYCGNCRWFNKSFFIHSILPHCLELEDWHECRLEKEYVDDYDRKKRTYRKSPVQKNEKNDCIAYVPRFSRKLKNFLRRLFHGSRS